MDEIDYFAQRRVLLVGITAYEESKIVNKKIHELPLPDSCMIAAVSRANGEVIIPRGTDIIYPHDKLYIAGKGDLLEKIDPLIRHKKRPNQNVVIFGDGKIGLQVAKALEHDESAKYNLKLIDKNLSRCEEVAAELEHTLVLNGDVTDPEFLNEEIEGADISVSVTGDDEVNLLTTLLAQNANVQKTISELIKGPIFRLSGLLY